MRIVPKQSDDHKKHISNVDYALKELKKMMKKEGVLQELKLREAYMSPSNKKRYRKNEALKRLRRDERKQDWYDKKNQQY